MSFLGLGRAKDKIDIGQEEIEAVINFFDFLFNHTDHIDGAQFGLVKPKDTALAEGEETWTYDVVDEIFKVWKEKGKVPKNMSLAIQIYSAYIKQFLEEKFQEDTIGDGVEQSEGLVVLLELAEIKLIFTQMGFAFPELPAEVKEALEDFITRAASWFTQLDTISRAFGLTELAKGEIAMTRQQTIDRIRELLEEKGEEEETQE